MLDMPPSTLNICPVSQLAVSDNKNTLTPAISLVVPILPSGCRFYAASRFSVLDNKAAAKGVSVSDGAMAFTLI